MNTQNNNYTYYNYYNDYNDYNDYTYLDDLFNDLLIELIILSLLNNTNNIPDTSIINRSLYERNPVKNVITDEVKNNLQSIKFKDIINKENNTSCAITQDEFSDEDMVIQLPCNHCFNSDAILHWLTEESCECPVCRYKLESKEKISLLNVTTNTNTNTNTNTTTTTTTTTTNPIIQYYVYY
jgi:hypothetical protein